MAKEDNGEFQKWLKELEVISIPNPEHFKYQDTYYRMKEGWVISEILAKPIFKWREKEFSPSDIVIASYPKSGTAWVQQLVYLIETLDFESGSGKKIEERYIFLERPEVPNTGDIKIPTETRFYNSHLPYSLLPKDILQKKCKIVHLRRNPKDTLVSMYNFAQMIEQISYKGTFKDLFHLFANNYGAYSPYAQNILEYWNRRNDENLLCLTYEGLHKDIISNINIIANFLGKTLTEQQVQQIADHCSFGEMKNNPATNFSHWAQMGISTPGKHYMRKGKVGDWRNYFDEQLERDFQIWFDKNFANEDITFEFDI